MTGEILYHSVGKIIKYLNVLYLTNVSMTLRDPSIQALVMSPKCLSNKFLVIYMVYY